MKAGKRLLALLLMLALATGAGLAYTRYRLENSNRGVELAVDARLLSGSDFGRGHSPQEGATELKAAGCTAVAVNALSLNDLEKRGEITPLTPTLYLLPGETDLGTRLQAALSPLLPDVEFKEIRIRPPHWDSENQTAAEQGANEWEEYQSFSLPARFVPAVKELPLIFPQEQMLAWQHAGLHIVPLFNYPARLSSLLSEKYWEVLAKQLQEIKHTTGIQFGPLAFPATSFSYPAPQGAAGTIFREEGFSLGAVEFTQGQGLRGLAAALDYRLFRTHQIPGAELAQLGEARARERFVRAVQERKIRLLLLQPFPEFDPRSEWAHYLPLMQNLGKDLQKAGFTPGTASFFPLYHPPAAAEALMGVGIAAATILLAGFFLIQNGAKPVKGPGGLRFSPLTKAAPQAQSPLETGSPGRNWLFPLAGTALILAVAGFLLAGEHLPFYTLGRQLAALAAALIFPLLSTLLFLRSPLHTLHAAGINEIQGTGSDERIDPDPETAEKEAGGKERAGEEGEGEGLGENNEAKRNKEKQEGDGGKFQGFLKKLVGGFLLASLLTIGGALLAAGLLSSTPFLLNIESFRGVKIAQLGPFLLFGLWFLLQEGQGLWSAGRSFLEARLQVKHLVLLALAGGFLLIYLLRGGNTSFLPVSSLELALRRHLEVLLVARPRFKEFLIGHPGFFLFAALAARRLRGARTLALLLGLLGQVSLFNTFMHLHRPVALSFLGTVYGVGLGLLGGLVLYGLVGAIAGRWPARQENK